MVFGKLLNFLVYSGASAAASAPVQSPVQAATAAAFPNLANIYGYAYVYSRDYALYMENPTFCHFQTVKAAFKASVDSYKQAGGPKQQLLDMFKSWNQVEVGSEVTAVTPKMQERWANKLSFIIQLLPL